MEGPSQVKIYATGKGNCREDLILQQVYKRWGVENNLADSYVLAQIGRGYPGEDFLLIKAQCDRRNKKSSLIIGLDYFLFLIATQTATPKTKKTAIKTLVDINNTLQ